MLIFDYFFKIDIHVQNFIFISISPKMLFQLEKNQTNVCLLVWFWTTKAVEISYQFEMCPPFTVNKQNLRIQTSEKPWEEVVCLIRFSLYLSWHSLRRLKHNKISLKRIWITILYPYILWKFLFIPKMLIKEKNLQNRQKQKKSGIYKQSKGTKER